MSPSAKHLVCMDAWCLEGVTTRDGPGAPADTNAAIVREEFFDNIDRYGARSKITVVNGRLEDVIPRLNVGQFDMVFYDADHSYQSTLAGAKALIQAGLRPDAILAFHDYAPTDPGVIRAVDDLAVQTGRQFRTVDSLAVFDPCEAIAQPTRYKVMLGFPYSGQVCWEACQGLVRASLNHDVAIAANESSALAHNFNIMWADALNRYKRGEITHFAMLHSDIGPEDFWLDILIQEADRLGAALISAVSPIKDNRGATSTGVGKPGMTWSPFRRMTIRELVAGEWPVDGNAVKFPETFNSEDLGYPGFALLHNTGCWVADLRHPAFHQANEAGEPIACFAVNDRIIHWEDSEYRAQFESEDWYMGRRLHELGAPTWATKKVRLAHIGKCRFENWNSWGVYEHDKDTERNWQVQPEAVVAVVGSTLQPSTETASHATIVGDESVGQPLGSCSS